MSRADNDAIVARGGVAGGVGVGRVILKVFWGRGGGGGGGRAALLQPINGSLKQAWWWMGCASKKKKKHHPPPFLRISSYCCGLSYCGKSEATITPLCARVSSGLRIRLVDVASFAPLCQARPALQVLLSPSICRPCEEICKTIKPGGGGGGALKVGASPLLSVSLSP